MNLTLLYQGRSAIRTVPGGQAVSLAPNLARDPVSFEGRLRDPLKFREAVSALHDVVIGDLRYKPRDKSAHEAFVADRKRQEDEIRRQAASAERFSRLENIPDLDPVALKNLEKRYARARSTYWKARQGYSNYLMVHDRELWRMLVPCDPVITVAPDVLFLECFSADESSYGCLTVDREAFESESSVKLGTTNVDYSWPLYEHFQTMRSYRETRFLVDPSGFEVRTEQAEGRREEKIDLPPSWLRGFLQLQAAMSLPSRKVSIDRESLYSILAFLRRNRARKSPRAVRFELTPGRPATIVLEPWEKRITVRGSAYLGPREEVIRVWGRDRLKVLSRLLPAAEEAEVHLLGSGLPSFWSIKLGGMRFLLGLSGWTANDWAGGSAIDQLLPPGRPSEDLLADLGAVLRAAHSQSLDELATKTGGFKASVASGLNRLALLGQVIHDLDARRYRLRQILPVPAAVEQIGPEHPETVAARQLVASRSVSVTLDQARTDGLRVLEGKAPSQPISLLLDADGRMIRGKCSCSHHFKGGLRKGPCRHLQALRSVAVEGEHRDRGLEEWFKALWN